MFRFFEQELLLLRDWDQAGQVDLWFSDESAFDLNPNGMYARQVFLPKGKKP